MSDSSDELEKIKIRDNLFQYLFKEDDNGEPNSIFVCIDAAGKKALILDTAFERLAEIVKKDLEEQGIQPEIVVLSHYHPDHAAGTPVFKDCRIYASEFYEDNYGNCQRWNPNSTFIPPTDLIKDGDSLTFASFQLKFFHAPGHSQCSVLTLINEDVLYIGDLLMYSENDTLSLPYISMGGSFKEHIQSLEKIKTMDYNILVCAHGHFLTDKGKITAAIDDWLYYLNRVLDSMGTLPLAVCLKNDIAAYAHTEHHDNNLMYLMV
jgi:glyoxylase-like metal-dependent hydrolase (beta-lactamase superfamily II)